MDRLRTRDGAYLFNLSTALTALGRTKQASQCCRIGLSFAPNDPFRLACLLNAYRVEQAATDDRIEATEAQRKASTTYSTLRWALDEKRPSGQSYSNLVRYGYAERAFS